MDVKNRPAARRLRRQLGASVLGLGLVWAASLPLAWNPAMAQEAGEPEAESALVVDPVIVTTRPIERTRNFVEQLTVEAPATGQLARWDNRVCPGVMGLPVEQSQFVADQIARRAQAVGLKPQKPGCTVNILVMFTDDSDLLANRMFENEAALFGFGLDNRGLTLGAPLLRDFLETPRAVRWWHVTQTVSADGTAIRGSARSAGLADGFADAAVVRSDGSRLNQAVRQDIDRVIIIVDARRISGFPLGAVADYVSLVSLAQVDPTTDYTSYPSILNLFSARTDVIPPAQMTEWDVVFLDSLYQMTRNARDADAQQAEIARRMSTPAALAQE